LAYGYGPYSKDAEKARKEIEKIGLDYDWAMEMANAVLNGAQFDWNAITKDLVTELDSQKSICDEFVAYLSESLSWGYDGFFGAIKELGGRDKLMGALDNILKTFKNIYRLVLTTGNAISEKFGGNSLILSILDGFNKLTGVFAITDEKFEAMEQSINDFFLNGGFEMKLVKFVEKLGKVKKSIVDFFLGKETLYKGNYYDETLQRTVSIYEREGGLFQKFYNLYQTYIGRLPENVRDSIEKIRTSISGFFGDVPKKFEELKTKASEMWTKVFGEEAGIGTYFNPITKKIGTYTKRAGGLIDEFKQKILSFGNGAVGKAIEWLSAGLKKIGDLLFGYKKDGEDVQGVITIIYDKMAAFWQMLKDIGKSVEDIFERFKSWLGLDFEKVGNSSFFDILLGKKVYKTNVYDEKLQRTVSIYERTGGILGKVKEAYSSFEKEILKIAESAAFIAIKNFIFGDEESKIPNIFGRIKEPLQDITEFFIGKKIHKGTTWSDELNSYIPLYERQGGLINKLKETIQDVTDSNAFKAIRNFIFGDEESKTPNIFGRIQSVIDSIAKSTAFIAIKNFIFGDEKANIPNIFGRIQSVIDSIAKSTAFIAIKNFIFGDEESKTPNIFGRIQSVIDSIVKSTAFIAIKNFIFGDEKANIPNIFGRIQSVIDSIAKSTAFIVIKNFIFGNEKANIPNIFGRIKETIQSITDSTAFKAVRNFIFGDEESKTPNIFGRIKEIIQSITDSTAFKTVRNFIFGDNEGNTNGSIGILERIQNFLQSIYESAPFKAIWRFFFGDEELNDGLKEGTETLDKTASKSKSTLHEASLGEKRDLYQIKDDSGRMIPFEEISSSNNKLTGFQKLLLGIKEKFEAITSSKAYNDIKEFFFGSKRAVYNEKFEIVGYVQDAPNIIQRIIGAIEKLPESIQTAKDAILNFFLGPVNEEGKRIENIFKRLPTYISTAKKNITEFFIGKKIHKGTTWSDELNSYIPLYEREGGLINKLKETFEKLKSEHPWFASFCSFIETQIQNIRKIFSEAGGDISLAFENLNTYLNGGHFKHKNALGEIETDLEETDGVITNIRKNIEKIFNGGKEKTDKSFIDVLKDLLGIGNPNIFSRISSFIHDLLGINLGLISLNVMGGNKFGFSIQSGLEVIIDGIKSLAESIMIIGATLLGLAVYIKLTGNEGIRSLEHARNFILSILNMLTAFSVIFSMFDLEIDPKSAIALTLLTSIISRLVILMGVITLVLKKFDISYKDEQFLTAAGVITGILILLTIFNAASTKVAKKGETVKSSAGTWWAMALSFIAISKAITSLVLSFAGLYLLTKKVGDISKFKDAGIILGIALTIIVGFIGLITSIANRLSKSGGDVTKGTFAALSVMLLSVSGFLVTFLIALGVIYYVLDKNKDTFNWKILAGSFGILIVLLGIVSGFIASISAIMSKMSSANSGFKITTFVMIMLMMSSIKSIIAIASVLALESKSIGWENVAAVFIGLAALLYAAASTIKIISSIDKINISSFKAIGLMLAAITSIAVLAAGLLLVADKLPLQNVNTNLLPLLLAVVEISAIAALISKAISIIDNTLTNKDKKGNVFSKNIANLKSKLFLVAASLAVLVVAVFILTDAVDKWSSLRNLDLTYKLLPLFAAISELAGVMIAISFAIMAINKTLVPSEKGYWDVVKKLTLVGSMLFALTRAIIELNAVVDASPSLKNQDLYSKFVPLFTAIIELATVMAGLSYAIAKINKNVVPLKEENYQTLLLKIGGVVAFTLLLMKIIEIINNYVDASPSLKNQDLYSKFVPLFVAIIELAAVMAGLSYAVAKINKNIVPLKEENYQTLLLKIGGVIAFTLLLMKIIEIINNYIDASPSLKNQDLYSKFAPLFVATSELAAVMVIMSLIIAAINKIIVPSEKGYSDIFKKLGLVSLMLIALTAAIAALSSIVDNKVALKDPELVTKLQPLFIVIGELAVALVVLSAALKLMSILSLSGKGFLVGIGMLAMMELFALGVWGLLAISRKADVKSWKELLPMFESIGAIAVALVALTIVLGVIGLLGTALSAAFIPAVITILAVTVGVILMGAAIVFMYKALKKLEEIASDDKDTVTITDSLAKLTEMMVGIAHMLGEMIGAFVGGLGEGISGSLPAIATNLSDFITNLRPFLDEISKVTAQHLLGAVMFTIIVGSLAVDTFVTALPSLISALIGTQILEFGTLMSNFITNLKPFLDALLTIKPVHALGAVIFTEIVATLAVDTFISLFPSLVGALVGVAIKYFGTLMSDFITNLKPFLDALLTIKPAHALGAAIFTEIVATLAVDTFISLFPSLVGALVGVAIKSFGTLMSDFITNLKPFLDALLTIKPVHATNAVIFKKVIASIAVSTFISAVPSLISAIVGTKIEELGTSMSTFITNLTPFLNTISTLTDNHSSGARRFTGILIWIGASQAISAIGSLINSKFNSDSSTTMAVKLNAFLTKLRPALIKMTSIKQAHIDGAKNLTAVLWEITKQDLLSALDSFISLFGGENNYSVFAGQVSDLSGAINSMYSDTKEIDKSKLDESITLIKTVLDFMTDDSYRVGGLAGWAKDAVEGKIDFKGLFDKLNGTEGEPGIVDGLITFSDKVNGKNLADANTAAYVMKALFGILSVDTNKLGSFSDFVTNSDTSEAITNGITYLTTKVIPKITEMQSALNNKDFKIDPETIISSMDAISSIFEILSTNIYDITSLGSLFDKKMVHDGFLIFGKWVETDELENQDIIDLITNGIVFITDFLIPAMENIQDKLSGNNFSDVGALSEVIKKIFEVLSFNSKDISGLGQVSTETIETSFNTINTTVITALKSLQDALSSNSIDSETIKNTIGSYADLINGFIELQQMQVDGDFSQLGKNIIDGLILSFSNMDDRNRVYESALKLGQYIAEGLITGVNGSTDALDTAGTDMADTVTEATADELEVASPSRVMYEIGQFVVQGLINGIHAGSYEAKKEAERLSAVIEDGVSKHDINMAGVNIEMDWELAYGNLDNLKDSVGNIDFEKIREFLHGQYDELLGTEYIDAFINSWAGKWKQIPQILDETQSKIVKGIANNEYGYTQEEILTNLEKELGSAEDAQKAWQNYNDVLADNIKLNQENAKEQVASAQMTKEEYAEIERLFNEAHSGKYDAQNGDTRVDRLVKEAGATREQAELVQRMLNDQYEYGLSPSYVRAEKQLKELREEEEARRKTAAETSKAAETTAESMTDATDGIDAATESLDNLKTTEEAVAEAADDASKSIVKIKDSAKEVLKNVDKKTLQEGYAAWKAGRDMTAEQAEQFNYIRKQNRLQNLGSRGQRDAFYKELGFDPKDANDFFNNADPYQNARRRMEGNAESYSRVVEKETEAAKKAAEAKGSIKDTLDYIEENESSDLEKNKKMYQEAFKDTDDLLNAAFDRMRKGEKLTEDQVDFLYEFQKAIGTDIFGSGKDRRKEFKSLGISEENLDMAMRIYGWNLEKYNQTAKEASNSTTDLTKKITQNGAEAEMMSMVYEALPEEIKGYADGFSDIFTAAFDEKTGNIKITDDIYKKVFKVNDVNKLTGIGKTVYDTIGTGFEMGKGTLENLLKENGLELNGKSVSSFFSKETFAKMFQSDSGIFDLAGTIKENIDPLQMFGDFIGGLFSGKSVKGSASAALVNGLSNAFKLSQNVVENVEEISNTVLDPEADLTDLDYFNAYLEKIKENYALITDSEGKAFIAIKGYQNLIEGKDLTTSQAQELTKLYDAVVQGFYGKDHDEIQQNLMEMFNIDWDVLRGNGRNFEQYANQYLEYADKVTAKRDAGEKYTAEDFVRDVNAGKFGLDAETRKKVFEAADIDVQRGEELYQNWLKDGNKALEQIGDDHIFLTKQEKEAAETVKQTNEILASTPEGAFQAVANFLDGVEKAITNKNAAKDFRTFMDDIKDIFSKDNMKIEGASDFGQIADFIKMVDTTSNNSNGLKDSFSTLMNGISQTINGLSIDETKLDPITNFLDKLDASSEVFTNGDSSGIQKFVDNLYSAMENSGGDASAAANTIAEVINVTLLEKQDKFVEIGQFIVIWIAAGMIAYQNVVREAANQTATTLTTAFNQQAVDKAPQSGKDFITEFTKGIVSEESVSALDTALNTLFSSLNEATAAAGETTEESSALGGGSAGTRFGQQFVHDMAQSITEGSVTAFTGLTQSIANLPQSISEALDEDKQKELTAAVDGISSMLSGIVPDGSSMAMNMIEGIISTLTANGPLIADLMAWIAAGAQGEFNRENESKSPSRKYKKFAGYITDGIVIGLQNGSRDVNKASADVALGALNTAKDVLGIHSPGKEPEEQIGIPYDQGVAKGIENGEPAVQAAVTDMAENAVETGNSVISKNLGKSIDTGLFRNNLMNNLNNLSPYPAGTNKYLQDVQNDIKNIMGEIITTEENGLTVGQTLTERAIEHFMSATSGIKTMTEEEAAVIQGFWSQILNGDFGVLEGANSATGREAMLKDMKLTWEQFARFSNNTSTLDLSSITKGINDYSDAVGVLTKDSSMEDVINSIYSGLLGNGEKRKEAIEGLGKDYDFTQFILKKMWNLKPGEKIDYDFIDANYEALLNSFNDAVAAGKDLLGEEMDEAVPIVISPTVDDTALNAARDKIIEATTSQQEAQKVATTERGNAPKVGDNTESTGGSAPSVVYNQYNTSPKPIDALEVYRRTANQFAQMRGLLHADD